MQEKIPIYDFLKELGKIRTKHESLTDKALFIHQGKKPPVEKPLTIVGYFFKSEEFGWLEEDFMNDNWEAKGRNDNTKPEDSEGKKDTEGL